MRLVMGDPVSALLGYANLPEHRIQVSLAAGFSFLTLYLLWVIRNYRRIRSVLSMPRNDLGLWGNLPELIRAQRQLKLGSGPKFSDVFSTYIVKLCEKHRDAGLVAFHGFHPLLPISRPIVFVCDLAIAKQVLGHKSYGLFQKGKSYRLSAPLVGAGLLSVGDGPKWRLMRDLTNSGFKLPVLERSIGLIERVVRSMMRRWSLIIQTEGHTKLDVYEESLRLTLDVLGLVAFSHDFESVRASTHDEAALYDSFQTILSTLTYLRQTSRGVPAWLARVRLLLDRPFQKASLKLTETCQNLIERRRSALAAASSPIENDILESFLAKDEQGMQRLDDACIIDNMKTLLFAGHDTTASALTWSLYLLAAHPAWQDRLRSGLRKAGFSSSNGMHHESLLPPSFSYNNLDDLVDLTAVVRETLRLYPSAGFSREAVRPVVLRTSKGAEYEVCPGTELFFFPNFIQTDPAHMYDANEFKPERWLDASTDLKQAWFPFSFGPRNCVGERLALAELRIVLALLIQNFRFELPSHTLQSKPFQVLLLSLQPYNICLKITELEKKEVPLSCSADSK